MDLTASGYEEWECEGGKVLLIPSREAEKRRAERRMSELAQPLKAA